MPLRHGRVHHDAGGPSSRVPNSVPSGPIQRELDAASHVDSFHVSSAVDTSSAQKRMHRRRGVRIRVLSWEEPRSMKSLQFASAPLIVTERKHRFCILLSWAPKCHTSATTPRASPKLHNTRRTMGPHFGWSTSFVWVVGEPADNPSLGARVHQVTHALQEPRRCDQVEFLSVKSYNKEPTHHH